MSDISFFEPKLYYNFTFDHYLPIILFFITTYIIIKIAQGIEEHKQNRLGFIISLIAPLAIIIRMTIHWQLGEFSLSEDLPLHLCRALPFVAPFMMIKRSPKMFDILYFLIMAGTLNAVITADIVYTYPHYEYYIYWFLHFGLIILPLYAIFIYGFRPKLKGIFHAFIALNIFLVFVVLINNLVGSNYLFVMHKPEVATIMDYLGPWPWYILSLEGLVFVFSFIVYLPFFFVKTNIK